MRTVKRNRIPVAYAFYNGVEEIIKDGNYTGEYKVKYTEPVRALMNVSGGRGQATVALFGMNSSFSRTAVTEDLETPFSTETVFWIDTDPDSEPHDYIVVAVARTINQVVLALDEVNVTHSEEIPSA